MILPCLTVAPSTDRGRGVYTTEFIPANTLVEVSPVLALSPEERKEVEKTKLFDYIFEWGEDLKSACVALGYLSVYNHSYDANCIYEMEFENDIIRITTIKDVQQGEELFINYNADPDNKNPIWFQAK